MHVRPPDRREFLRIGGLALGGLTLADILKARAVAQTERSDTSVILLYLSGGASHLETYDPKPDASSEIRGIFGPISTRVAGLRVSELLPLHAKIADKFTLVRSMSHTGGGHPAGSLQMLTGDPDPQDKKGPIYPDWMTVANLLRRERRPLPNYVGVNPVSTYDGFIIAGSAYLKKRRGQ